MVQLTNGAVYEIEQVGSILNYPFVYFLYFI